MKLESLIQKYGNVPVIESAILLAGASNPKAVAVQLARWKNTGKLIQIKRGVYLLAETYRRRQVYEPYLATLLAKPSYLSMEKALEHYGLIPEGVPVYTSVTTKRPARFVSKAGVFVYRHIKKELFWGYGSLTMDGQTGFMAVPEKALLDLIYFRGMKIDQAWLEGLRLQQVEKLSVKTLNEFIRRFHSPGMERAGAVIRQYIDGYSEEGKTL
jgi:predicted transcriptional regulator of viral defense system